jgi:hypothetical protein
MEKRTGKPVILAVIPITSGLDRLNRPDTGEVLILGAPFPLSIATARQPTTVTRRTRTPDTLH